MKRTMLLAATTLLVGGLVAVAQVPPAQGRQGRRARAERPQRAQRPRPLQRPQPGMRQRAPRLPILQVLDANHDGVIDAKEIENAKTALLKLDKNKDGKLTRDEYLPPRPQRPGRPGAVRGQQGQRPRRGGAGPAGAPPAGPPPVQ